MDNHAARVKAAGPKRCTACPLRDDGGAELDYDGPMRWADAFGRLRVVAIVVAAVASTNCADTIGTLDVCRCADARDAALVDARGDIADDTPPSCSSATCAKPGQGCVRGLCVDDCRPSGANECLAGTICDFTDGHCRPPGAACVLPLESDACPSPTGAMSRQCGPGTICDGQGSCVVQFGCTGLDCDERGRCWARSCPCDRPAPRCSPATLMELNRADFAGSPVNGSDSEGAFDLEFDDACNAYSVTMISGPDYFRQLTPRNELTTWTSTTNLNMGEVAVFRVPGVEYSMDLGDAAATYICCATCGCITTGMDGRLGVIRLDRTSTTRPLPNVLPAMPTTGTAPFGSPTLDTGPYGLTWGGDHALYVGNVMTNGDFMRVDLATARQTMVATFPRRVVASAPFDLRRLLVATEGGSVYLLETATGMFTPWAMLAAAPTSLARDVFSGAVYAELGATPPRIVAISRDGRTVTDFQTAPARGRIAIAPDNQLYHLNVYPNVHWRAGMTIVRWPLPATR